MRTWLAFCLIGVLSGCSSQPIQIPTCVIDAAPVETTQPLSLPELPAVVSATDTTASFDLEGMQQLKRYRIASETNTAIASDNASALQERNQSVNALIECGKWNERFSEIREEQLRQERHDRFVDSLWYRGIIALGLIAVVL